MRDDDEHFTSPPLAIEAILKDAEKNETWPEWNTTLPDPSPLTDEALSSALIETARQQLFYTAATKSDRPITAILNVATLNRIFIMGLQQKLAVRAKQLCDEPKSLLENLTTMKSELQDYCEAIRNMDLMQQHAADGYEKDPFTLTSDHYLLREILNNSGLLPDYQHPKGDLPICKDIGSPSIWGIGSRVGRIHQLEKKQLVLRLFYALGGGLSLIVPMLIMIYVPGRTASVVTTCAFMAGFALIIAVRSEFKPNEVLAVTSAYAAVLVVFVGVKLGNTS